MSRSKLPTQILPAILVFLSIALTLAVNSADTLADPNRTQVLDHTYAGFLYVEFICTMPEFSSSAQMDVHINRQGVVSISDADMSYGGSEDLQDGCVYERTGTWEIRPYGYYLSGPPEHIAVNENIFFSEHITMICPPPVGTAIDESPSGQLNGGLAFDFADALMDGAVVEASNGVGDLIRWTLGLVVGLPNEQVSWSAMKARYSD